MKVSELIEKLSLNSFSLPSPEREIRSAYVGDLLSWVMGKAREDCAWVTIMSNVNVLAVASLADVACVILAEGVTPAEELISAAEAKGINLLSSEKDSYSVCAALAECGIKGLS